MRLEEGVKELSPEGLAEQNLDDINAFLLKIQRNPDHYAEEVAFLLKVFLKEYEKVKANPSQRNDQFYKLLDFFTHVIEFYEADLKFLVESCEDLLRTYPEQLERELRIKLTYTLIFLSRKGYWNELVAIKFFFDLLAIKDKEIRSLIFKHMIQLTDKIDHHGKRSAVHKELLDHIAERSREPDFKYAKNIFKMLIALMKKEIWKDAKVVNLIAEGTYHDSQDIVMLCCRFFVENVDKDELEISSDEEEKRKDTFRKGKTAKFVMGHQKKTKSGQSKLDKMRNKVKHLQGNTERKENTSFLLIELLYNPLSLCDMIFSKMKSSKMSLKAKLCQMGLLSRIIWRNELIFPNYFHYLHRYIKSNSNELPQVLSCLAGCCHSRTPMNELGPIVKLILQNFANEAASHDRIVMGVNTLREICFRVPDAMEEDDIYEVCHLRKIKHKRIAGPIKAFINTWRGIDPKKLKKEYRGREWQEEDGKVWETSQVKVRTTIEGIEHLNKACKI